jgi:hypothetical protein
VKGEGLVGTITSSDESSAADGETISTPPSGASTPPTSVSDRENTAKPTELEPTTMTKERNYKRKRGNEEATVASKRPKQESRDAGKADVEAKDAPVSVKTQLGTFDADQILKINSFLDDFGKQALRIVEKKAKKGAYGALPSTDMSNGEKKGKPSSLSSDESIDRRLTYTAVNRECEKAIRDAKRDLMKNPWLLR